MSDIVQCRAGSTPCVVVDNVVAIGRLGPAGLRKVASDLVRASYWLERQQQRNQAALAAARRRIDELERIV